MRSISRWPSWRRVSESKSKPMWESFIALWQTSHQKSLVILSARTHVSAQRRIPRMRDTLGISQVLTRFFPLKQQREAWPSSLLFMRRWRGLFRHEFLRRLRPQQREEDHIANRARAGQQHGQAIDADALASGRRQTIRQRPDVVFIHGVRLFIAALFFAQLLLDAPALFFRIVQFAEGVADLQAADEDLEALHPVRLAALVFRERRNRHRELIDKGRLDQIV